MALGEGALALDAPRLAVMVAVVSARPRLKPGDPDRRKPVYAGPWRPRAKVEAAGHDPAVIDGLVAAGWLVSWTATTERGKVIGPYLLPTPYGAGQMGCMLWDSWDRVEVKEERERTVRTGKRTRRERYTAKVKRPAEVTRWEDVESALLAEIRLPADPNLCPVPEWLWSEIPDTRPGNDPVEEAIAREEAARNAKGQAVRMEGGEPVVLMGSQIVIDPRLGPKRAG